MRDIVAELEIEKQELLDKSYKLQDFTNTDQFKDLSLINRDLLVAQLGAMRTYKHILTARITILKEEA